MRGETIQIPKETMNIMIRHFEVLLRDFEKIMEKETMRKVDKRLADIKKDKVRGHSEKEYHEFMKRKGVNVK